MNRHSFTVLVLSLAFLPGLVFAQPDQPATQIDIDPADNPLIITGWLAEADTFQRSVRLVAHGGDIATFTFLASDLRPVTGTELIDRHKVTLLGDPALAADVPHDFQIQVMGISNPGTYTGTFTLLLPNQAPDAARTIPLTVIAMARPSLTALPGTDQVQWRLVNCTWWLDCVLARGLLPASAFLDRYELQFDNAVKAPATITDIRPVVMNSETGYQLTAAELGVLSGKQTLPADQIVTIPLTLTRQLMPPDHYTGSIYLTLEGRDERLKVPVDLNVRCGPFWPIMIILLGIIFGRLVKYMQERGAPQAVALEKINRFTARLYTIDPADRQILEPMVTTIRQDVYQGKGEGIDAALQAAEGRLDTLQKLRDLERSLIGKQQDPDVKAIMQQIGQARQAIGDQKDQEATRLLNDIEQKVSRLNTSLMGGGDSSMEEAAQSAVAARDSMERTASASPLIAEPRWLARLKRFLIGLTGLADQVRAEATLWLVRPLLYIALLLGLLMLGIQSMYVDKGLSFGANPVADYLGLVLWGLSADVASRTLSNLPGST